MAAQRKFVVMVMATFLILGQPTYGQDLDDGADAGRSPSFYAGTEALWLMRTYPGSFAIASTVDRTATTIPGVTISLADLRDNAAEPGLRAWVGFGLGEGYAVELSYFGLQEWSRSATIPVQDPPFANSPFLGTSVPFANKSFDTTLTATLDSEVHNAEANLRRAASGERWGAAALVGFRYFHLNETIDITGVEQFISTIETTRTQVTNNLYGAQVGGEVSRRWFGNRLALSFNGKVGIFANNANQDTSNFSYRTDGLAGNITLAGGRGTTSFAPLYEGGLNAVFWFTRNVALRAGYTVLYVDQLALAPDQLLLTGTAIRSFPQQAYPPGTGSQITTSGDLFLHGPSVGLSVAY
ncbi:MAG: BBP7 family outer membrane beta-barrel protein [Gemmataceae bacterium]